jgi:3-oxoacyl-[acyl-carrier protein] reductase
MGTLDGRVAIVTAGGGPGIGAAMCRALAQEGAAVVVADIDAARAEGVADEVKAAGGRALGVPTDVSNGDAVRAMVEATVTAFGRVDILANHAGVIPGGPIEEITEAMWDRAIGVHLKGAFLCSQAVLPHMKAQNWGRIVSTASRVAFRASRNVRGLTDYAAGKAGVIGFSRALALEVGGFGITVNAIAPGLVSGSGMFGEVPVMSPEDERKASEAEGQVLPLRYVRPDEIAGALLYLVGPHAERVTGTVLHVNSGSYFGG